jgi:hypothetical protein
MGLESHIDRVLDEKGVFRNCYYFSFGLKCDDEATANTISYLLNSTGEFGEATPYFDEAHEVWGVKFDVYKS